MLVTNETKIYRDMIRKGRIPRLNQRKKQDEAGMIIVWSMALSFCLLTWILIFKAILN